MSDVAQWSTPVHALWRVRAGSFLELAKPRISVLVLVATGVGFYLGWPDSAGPAPWLLLIHTLIGTALVASSANALNQLLEAEFDGRMERTAGRPLPSGRLTAREVRIFGAASACIGLLYLSCFVNVVAATVASGTLLSYVGMYTPLKRVTWLCVFVGAISGALPPVIGWAAATGTLAIGAWLLFAIVFFWQLPHFAAIAWLYRDDYHRAGYPMLPVVDRDGVRLNLHVMTHSVGLIAATILPSTMRLTGPTYAIGAAVLGLIFLLIGVTFLKLKTRESARLHLLASVIYLPLLFALMVLDKSAL